MLRSKNLTGSPIRYTAGGRIDKFFNFVLQTKWSHSLPIDHRWEVFHTLVQLVNELWRTCFINVLITDVSSYWWCLKKNKIKIILPVYYSVLCRYYNKTHLIQTQREDSHRFCWLIFTFLATLKFGYLISPWGVLIVRDVFIVNIYLEKSLISPKWLPNFLKSSLIWSQKFS